MTRTAFILVLITIVLWSLLAVLAAQLGHVPPFLLVGLTLCIAGLVSLFRWRDWRVSWKTFAIGVAGIFGNLFFYYNSLQKAPVVEANLLNYLYPLWMVFLTPFFFKGERIRAQHLLGALAGMAGAALILSGGRIQFQGAAALGYLSALAASVIWAVYSLATRWLPPFPSGAVGGFCMASGLLALGVFGIEYRSTGYLPVLRPVDWVYLALIGAGPCAVAYFTWDASLKRGDPRLLGILTYFTPLTSSLLLIASGGYALSPLTWLAMALIVGGAILSSIGRGGDSLAKQGELVP